MFNKILRRYPASGGVTTQNLPKEMQELDYPENTPIINAKNLYKVYVMGETRINALCNVNIKIGKNEFTAIIGPSGSGKSTLMNILGCLDMPTSGSYELDGMETSKLRDNELAEIRSAKIGFIFQGFNLLQKLTALENVELPLIYKGTRSRERQKKALEALHSVGLEDRVHHKPSELSGGQQQRVAIARALVTDPPMILADEPTGNLDTKSGSELMKLLSDLNDRGNTIVVITHDINIARSTKRMIRIQDGQIIEDTGVR